jgi:hypothetical protein
MIERTNACEKTVYHPKETCTNQAANIDWIFANNSFCSHTHCTYIECVQFQICIDVLLRFEVSQSEKRTITDGQGNFDD